MTENEITEKVIGAAIEVHRHLGPGLLESGVLKNGIKRFLNEYSGPALPSPRKSPDLRVSAVKDFSQLKEKVT